MEFVFSPFIYPSLCYVHNMINQLSLQSQVLLLKGHRGMQSLPSGPSVSDAS